MPFGDWLASVPAAPPWWPAFIGPGVVLLSIAVAVFGVLTARSVARQKATLDLIEKVESTPHYRDLNEVFSDLRRGRGFAHLGNPAPSDRATRRAVIDYLNHYEIVAIGLKRGILDKAIYRDWMHGPFVRDWNAAAEFIQRERWKWDEGRAAWVYRPSIYAFYQQIAVAWSPDAIRLSPDSGPPPARPGGPGDEALPEIAGQPAEEATPAVSVDNTNR